MHTVWKGKLSFDLVNIGVKLHSAIEEKDVKLISLHKDCMYYPVYIKSDESS